MASSTPVIAFWSLISDSGHYIKASLHTSNIEPRHIQPTTDWKVMANTVAKDALEVATDRFYVNVLRQ